MKKQILTFVMMLLVSLSLWAQQNDPVLFTVENTPVNLSEFKYIYSKTNGDKATFSKESLQEYLDLYVKFKLKVQRAKEMQLDTIPTLKKELAGYRRQLANSYLIDKEVTNRLTKEAYDRSLQDVNLSHIMIGVKSNATPADTLAAYEKIKMIQQKLKDGGDFAKLALEYSNDPSAKKNSGNIGYVTALLPNGFYPLENAMYTLPKGKLSDIIRTGAGYHLAMVNDVRPARGEVEIAHILVRKPNKAVKKLAERTQAEAKFKIDSIYKELVGGGNFEELAKNLSEDNMSNRKGGYIGYFGINRYEPSFENSAFGIKNDNEYDKPIETSVGWHIIKRISKKPQGTYADMKRALQTKIQKDGRYQLAKTSMINRIKRDANFQENKEAFNKFTSSLDDSFLTHKWTVPANTAKGNLFSLGKENAYSVSDFADYCKQSSRIRLRAGKSGVPAQVALKLYNQYVEERCIDYEEKQLEQKYPDFKSLMREYEEGILLFEATKILVWDKASQDSVGLEKFYAAHKDQYKWKQRAVADIYTIRTNDKAVMAGIQKAIAKGNSADVLKRFNKENKVVVSVEEKTFEKGRNEFLDRLKWKPDEISPAKLDEKKGYTTIYKIKNVMGPSVKTLKEARGYVVADYQDQLEKEWLKELQKSYKVDINDKVFNSIIKK